jgi:hypothetical protein
MRKRLITLGLAAMVLAGAGCQNVPNKVHDSQGNAGAFSKGVQEMVLADEKEGEYASDRPSFNEFKYALGDRYISDRDEKLRSYLAAENVNRLELVYKSYADPSAVVAGFDDNTRSEYEEFDLDSYTPVDKQILIKDVPWKIVFDENASKSDRLYLFALSKFLE